MKMHVNAVEVAVALCFETRVHDSAPTRESFVKSSISIGLGFSKQILLVKVSDRISTKYLNFGGTLVTPSMEQLRHG